MVLTGGSPFEASCNLASKYSLNPEALNLQVIPESSTEPYVKWLVPLIRTFISNST